MTEKESLMYRIIGNITDLNAPIVFKGALITKLILSANGYTELERQTKDIDANWIGIPPSMTELANLINQSLPTSYGTLHAEAIREYGEKKSAGISIIEANTGDILLTMDISIKPVQGSQLYYFGETAIKGVLPNEILADKISVLSKKMIFRRAKDIIDVYALAHCVKVHTIEIFELYDKTPNRKVETFEEFYNRIYDLKHAYESLSGIKGKPVFDDVYFYLKNFIEPFAKNDRIPRIWNSNSQIWDQVDEKSKPSILNEL